MAPRQVVAAVAVAAGAVVGVALIFSPFTQPARTDSGPAPAVTTAATPSPSASSSPSPSPSATPPPSASPTPSLRPRPSRTPSASPSLTASPTPTPSRPTSTKPLKPGSRGVVYLTFDDGPSAYTPQILDILSRTGSTATFFQLGNHRQQFPDVARRVVAEGHAIGNHTFDHADLTKLSAARLRWELANGPQARCVRPPYGATNATVLAAIHRIGSIQVLWSADTLDWTLPGSARIVARASGPTVVDGSIVLMHDGGGNRRQTVAALPMIIENLHDRGYLIRKLPACS